MKLIKGLTKKREHKFIYSIFAFHYMGWFSNLFGKKQETEEVSIINLYSWFEAKTEHIVKAKNEEVDSLINSFKQSMEELKRKIKNLETAELQNPNITPTERSYMTGNKESYIKQINLFIQQMPEFGEDFVEEFNEIADIFSKKSHKNYVITSQFFKDQISDVAKEISKLSEIANRMKFGSSSQKYLDVENIKKDIKNLINKINIKKILENKKTQILNEIQKLNDNDLLFQSNIEEKEKSEEYKNYIHANEMLEKFNNDLKYMEYYITELFSPLKRAFRKYSKMSMMYEKILNKYEQDEVKSWLDDKELKILNALRDMKKSIENMGFDAKEQIKILEKTNQINEENLNSKKEEYIKTTKEISLLKAEIMRMRIIKDIENMKYDIKKNKEIITEEENKLTNVENDLAEVVLESISEEIIKHIKELLNINLKIV